MTTVVIGSNYGDEGKGLAVDYFAHQNPDAIVVRFNGGAQAGHTVTTHDDRHVFHHFGSGTLNGNTTFLAKEFVTSPIHFRPEHNDLLRYNPKVVIDANCMVTTPYDMLINQMTENLRANNRHGSCGAGFGETIERHEQGFNLRIENLASMNHVRYMLQHIKEGFFYKRLLHNGFKDHDQIKEYLPKVDLSLIIDRYINDIEYFLDNVEISSNSFLKGKDIIFEGAQGLALDQFSEDFPHVTRSNTGLLNIIPIIKDIGIKKLDVFYMSRVYNTRHGAGPFSHEMAKPVRFVDNTNVHNEWQGSLRIGYLDWTATTTRILKDVTNVPNDIEVNSELFFTCADQVDTIRVVKDGERREVDLTAFFETNEICHVRPKLISYGPTRKTIKEII